MKRLHLLLFTVVVLVIGLVPLQAHFNAYHVDLAVKTLIAVTLASSLHLLMGRTGQFSLGHAGFMALGAYTGAAVSNMIGRDLGLWHGCLALLPALLAGGLVAAVAGVAIGIPSLRLRGDYLAIVTLGFGEILAVVLQIGQNRIIASETWHERLPWVGSAAVRVPGRPLLGMAVGMAALTLYAIWAMTHSTWGMSFQSTRDDETASSAMGVSTARAKIVAFVIGAFFAGIAGAMYGHLSSSVAADGFRFDRSVEIVLMVILGGSSLWGVAFAAVAVTLLMEALGEVKSIPGLSETAKNVLTNRYLLFSLVLILIMILRPQGLFSGWKIPAFLRKKEGA